MQTLTKAEKAARKNTGGARCRRDLKLEALRRAAEERGIPQFVLRLAAARHLPVGDSAETTLRHRRD